MKKSINEYVLAPDVFFREMPNGDVVLYQTSLQNVFVVDNSSYELLQYLREKREKSLFVNLEMLSKAFPSIDQTQLNESIEQMLSLNWITKRTVLEEKIGPLETAIKVKEYGAINKLSDVQFELTFRCNERCKHCYCPTDNDIANELTTEEIKKVLNDLYDMDVVSVTFTGGDLFVREDTFEILEYAYSLGFVINIFTNGTLLREPDFYRLKSIYPRSIHFSIYNSIPEKHDAFTRLPGSFEKTVSAIKKCKLLGIPVNIKVSLTEDNFDDVDGICELAKSLDTTIQISLQITPTNKGGMEPTTLRLNNAEKYAEVMNKVDKHILLSCSGDTVSFEGVDDDIVCGAGAFSLNINPYGEVFPCNALLISCGNVRNMNIKDIWNNAATLQEVRNYRKSMIKGCEKCTNKANCDFCPGSALQETGDPLKRYSEACTIAEAKIIKGKGEKS